MTGFELDLTVSLSVLLSFGSIIFAWFRTRRKDVDDKIEAARTYVDSELEKRDSRLDNGSKRMTNLEMRQQASEQALANMPGKDHLHRLEVALAEMIGDLKAMNASMSAIAESQRRTEKIVGAHESHLREKG